MNRKEGRKDGQTDGRSEVGWMCEQITEGKGRSEVCREEPEEQAQCLSAGNAAPRSF